MRKLTAIILIIMLLITMSACGNVEAGSIRQYEELDELVRSEIDDNAELVDCVDYENTAFAILKISKEIEIHHFLKTTEGYSNNAIGNTEKINIYINAEDVDYLKFILLEYTNGKYYLQVLANTQHSVTLANVEFMMLNFDENYKLHIARINDLDVLANDIIVGNKNFNLE